jgi:glycerol-3-phosphate acyltransferase PlsY
MLENIIAAISLSHITVLTFAYLLGSIPFGLVLTSMAGLGDIREIGSGNVGATNVLRTGKKKLALLTLLLDSGKGGLAVLIVFYAFPGSEDGSELGYALKGVKVSQQHWVHYLLLPGRLD